MSENELKNQLNPLKGAALYLILALVWFFITIRLTGLQNRVMLQPLLCSKFLLVAIIFAGRFLLLPGDKDNLIGKWSGFSLWLIIFAVDQFEGFRQKLDLGYLTFRFVDIILWSFFLTEIIKALVGLYRFWIRLLVAEPLSLRNLWQAFWSDSAKVGLFLTLLAATGYYYITSFFLIDTVLYSYLLLIPILTAVIMLYVVFTTKVRNWLRKVLEEVDQEATGVLQWQRFKAEPEMIDLLPWYEYILLVRDYLVKLAKPIFYPSTIFYYMLYCGFILSLPYILGIAIEV